jgi:cytochrome c biogenesis factor
MFPDTDCRSTASGYLRYTTLLLRVAGLCARHPGLIGPALGAAWRFRAAGWYRRFPFLPVPPAAYMAWRLETAFGSASAVPEAAELRRYLQWTRRMKVR